ncbi:MAG: anhydro-N-acetylmuramic acid kinase [Rikenellaceae bacterium]|nr:anhydro-N-acetylmuramic acid kinase [Rikenellaceae bacterium]
MYYAIGIMSGTSLDGVDAALVKIEGRGVATQVELIGFTTTEIPESLKAEIKRAVKPTTGTVDLLCSLNFKLGYLFADAAKAVCRESGFPIEKVDFIASHGQTVWHIPKPNGEFARSTLQIGEPAVIAYETGVKVISNFRTMDVAAGGEGAPLVPYSEFVLYASPDENVALQNNGGIGNVTVLPSTGNMADVYAFDTGPGNMIIDEVMQRLYGRPYDEGGKIAASGKVNTEMLDELMSHPYISMPLPKSTGREMFGEQYTIAMLERWGSLPAADLVATATAFTARTIAEAYRRFVIPKWPIGRTVLGGGGAHNATLRRMLAEELPGVKVMTQDEIGLSSDAKEAIAFAIMGNETMYGYPSNVCSATSASRPVILGNITPAPRKE